MARDSFYGVPLPPNEEVGRSPCPLPGRCYLVAPSLMFHLAVGVLCRSGVSQPLPSIRTYARRACCCFGGCPLSPLLIRGSPPLPLLQAFREDHVLLLGGDPPPPPPSPGCAREEHADWSGFPSPLLWPRADSERCWVGITPTSSIPWLHDGGARFPVGESPSSPWLGGGSTRCWVGVPPLPPSPSCTLGEKDARLGCPPLSPGCAR